MVDERKSGADSEGGSRRGGARERFARAAEEARERNLMAERTDASDEEIVERLRNMGFDHDSVRILDLIPLVHVAWAEGSVTRRERERILDIMLERQVEPHSEAFQLVETLLEEAPSATWVDGVLDVLARLKEDQPEQCETVLEGCRSIAEASGGLFGLFNPISEKERCVIGHIRSLLLRDGESDAELTKSGNR